MRLVYLLAIYLLAPIAWLALAWRGLRDPSYRQGLTQRFGFGPASAAPSIWVHAVSVGEVQAASSLVQALRARYPHIPLTLTTVTPTGAARARALFGDRVDVRYVPYDLPGSVRRFFERVKPRVAVILETELWPNLYRGCGTRGIPLVLASARISPRSVGRYRMLASLFRETLSHGIVIAAQGEGDAERFRAIGANPAKTHVVGNIKFDLELPADIRERGARRRAEHSATGRFLWVAGSTHEGEEEAAIAAQAALAKAGVPNLLVIAPRHPPRFGAVADLLAARGVRSVRRSIGGFAGPDTQVLLLDTLGELMEWYAAADAAFVGGSLVPVGGHNLLEPAALAVATVTGPHVFNAEDIATALVAEGAVEQVQDAAGLADAMLRLARDAAGRERRGRLGQALVERNRGTLQRLMALLEPLVSASERPAP
ncbi:MAG: 3-deoxy-D-manno-octulosonic acid transferase [Gammaproteobacteria bacterium]|nr:3-deoxy-D-manno-octulosonic acid transferase [Gammaproteobacteria bacterium]